MMLCAVNSYMFPSRIHGHLDLSNIEYRGPFHSAKIFDLKFQKFSMGKKTCNLIGARSWCKHE